MPAAFLPFAFTAADFARENSSSHSVERPEKQNSIMSGGWWCDGSRDGECWSYRVRTTIARTTCERWRRLAAAVSDERIQSDAHGRRRRCVEKRERELKSKAVSIAKQLKKFKSVFIVMKRPSRVERDAETETRVAHLKSSGSFVCGSGS
jgi:hypothetical protein